MKKYNAGELVIGLQSLKMALSRQEKEYLDYACDCVVRIDRLQRMIKRVQEGGTYEESIDNGAGGCSDCKAGYSTV